MSRAALAAKKLWKYVFPPVNIKFSVFAVLLGYTAAIVYGYEGRWLLWGADTPSWLVLLLVVITDFIAEGVWQHGHDILNDRGGISGFREDPSDPLVRKIAVAMVWSSLAWGVIVSVLLLLYARIAALAVGWIAAYLAWKYSKKRNECIPFIAVALAVAGGWFSATNMPGPELLTTMLIGGMASRLSLAFYRYDDYVGLNCPADFKTPLEVLVYYRNLFWIILWFPWLAMCLLLYMVLPWWIPFILSIPPLLEMIYRRRWWCHESNH